VDPATVREKIKSLVRATVKMLRRKNLDVITTGGQEQAICHRPAV
jgi:hypothetical protein